MDVEEKIQMVLEWADEKDRDFDTEFIESLEDYFANNGEITKSQGLALDNIIEKWHIER